MERDIAVGGSEEVGNLFYGKSRDSGRGGGGYFLAKALL